MVKRGKIVAIATAVVGVVVLVVAGLLMQDRIREEWYLWRLEKGSGETRRLAVHQLGELRSARAAPALVSLFRKEADNAFRSGYAWELEAASGALFMIGASATPAILEGISFERPGSLAERYLLALVKDIHEYSWDPAEGLTSNRALLAQVCKDPAQPSAARRIAADILTNRQGHLIRARRSP